MNELFDNYNALDPSLKLFWGCAIIASVIFLGQAILTMIGLDSTDGADVDLDFSADADGDTMDAGGGLSLFSTRNLVNFFVGFGWAGVSFAGLIEQKWLLYIIAVAVGFVFVWMFFFIKKQTKKLESDGTIDIRNYIGNSAQVYLRIPGNMEGKGKIQISINGSVREYDAFTDNESIATGKMVIITEVIDDSTVKVK